jgi:hypothetical protein
MGEWRDNGADSADLAARLELTDGSAPWRCMPDWLGFFLRLGERVVVAHEGGFQKTCVVVIPPVRSFAALFCATGAVVGVATTTAALPDIDVHFASLVSLEAGTPLVVKMGERIYAAAFSGVTERSGRPYIVIEYDGMTQYLPKQECHRVQVGTGGKRSLPTGRSPGIKGERVVEVLLGDHASQFLSVPTVDAVVVGRVLILEQEMARTRIRLRDEPAADAALGALLRPSRFLPDGSIPRSLVLSDRASEFELTVEDTPHVAVFDGARALSRFRHRFRESSWIAVLDRCSGTFQEGVDVANQEFAARKGPVDYLDSIELPPGTEMQTFERAR